MYHHTYIRVSNVCSIFGGTITKFKQKCQIWNAFTIGQPLTRFNKEVTDYDQSDSLVLAGAGQQLNLKEGESKSWTVNVPRTRYRGRDNANQMYCTFVFLVNDQIFYKYQYQQHFYSDPDDNDAKRQMYCMRMDFFNMHIVIRSPSGLKSLQVYILLVHFIYI